jgi:hypothetical protein
VEAQRVARAFLPVLMSRCLRSIKAFLADAPLRPNMPFERVRSEELGYILQRLRDLRLWSDTYVDSAQDYKGVADQGGMWQSVLRRGHRASS